MKVGFIGLGIMGLPMAKNLLAAGYELVVHNRSQGSVEALVALGAVAAHSPKEVAEQCKTIITMLPDSPDVEAVVFGDEGVFAGLQAGSLFIDMSTIAPATSIKIAEQFATKQTEALDAPVSGGEVGAIDGTLSIMVGGSERAFEQAKPLFEVMGKNIVRIGDAGAGQVTKACNQVVVGLTIQAISEALALAKQSGVDVAKVRSALLGGFAQSRILDLHGQRILDDNFKPGFKMHLHRKDLSIAIDASEQLALSLPATQLVASQMSKLIDAGKQDLDHSGLYVLYDDTAGA